MNKKSVMLFFSVLVLLSLGVLYVFGDISGTSILKSGDAYNVADWVTNQIVTINWSVTANAIETPDAGITNVSFLIDTGNFSWHYVSLLTGENEILNESGGDCEADNLTNVTYAADGTAWDQWGCMNSSASEINCFCRLDGGNKCNLTLGSNNGTLTLMLNITGIGGSEEADVNFSTYTNVTGGGNNTDTTLYYDGRNPRVYDVNITDGNTTYDNSSWGTEYILSTKSGPWVVTATIEDSTLGDTVLFAYNCNTTNVSFGVSEALADAHEVELLTPAPAVSNALNQQRRITSASIAQACFHTDITAANETFLFQFQVNDSFNHKTVLNATAGLGLVEGPFGIELKYDDGEILPWISYVNVTQTDILASDKSLSISKTLATGGTLDGTRDYLKGTTTLTIQVEVKGSERNPVVGVAWNDTGAATLTSVVNSSSWNATFGYGDTSLVTDWFNLTNTSTIWGIENDTAVVYNGTISVADNNSDWAFWVYTNNDGNEGLEGNAAQNYTTVAGPFRFTTDNSGPAITMTPPDDKTINPRNSITYTCTASDDVSGNNMMRWELVQPSPGTTIEKTTFADLTADKQSITFTGDDTRYAGQYLVKCIAIDQVGNEETYTSTDTESFTVSYSTYAPEEAAAPAAMAKIDLSTQEEVTIKEKQGVISTFTLDGTTIHKITIKEVDEIAGTVTLTIESDPIEITLKIGETKEVDIDADGENDISITLNSITDSTADITTKRLTPLPEKVPTEEVPPEEVPVEEVPEEVPSKAWLWILIIVIIVVIGVGYWFMKKKK